MAKAYDNGFSVLETNHIKSIRTGQIKAQYPFVDSTAELENGMLLVVDHNDKVVRFPFTGTELCGLHNSEEQIYQSHLGRNKFSLKNPKLPKVEVLTKGDIFETNAVDLGTFADLTAAKHSTTGAKYGIPMTTGFIKLLDSTDGAAALSTHCTVLKVVELITLPNGYEGIKFAVAQSSPIVILSEANFITAFAFEDSLNDAFSGGDVTGVIDQDAQTISLTVPALTAVTALIASFTASANSTVKVGSTAQTSGTTDNDFTTAVTYTVIAENGETRDYVVTVTVAE